MLSGVLTAMLVIGGVIAAMSIAVSQVLVILTPLTDLVVIGLGTAMLAWLNPLGRLPTIGTLPGRGSGATAAYSYGLLFGPLTLPCSGALVVGIFTLSLTVGSFLDKMVFFLVFGLGFGLPSLVLSVLAGGYQARLLRLATHHFKLVNRLAGRSWLPSAPGVCGSASRSCGSTSALEALPPIGTNSPSAVLVHSMTQTDYSQIGPAVGEIFPDFELPDGEEHAVRLHGWRNGRRALIVFYRSAAW